MGVSCGGTIQVHGALLPQFLVFPGHLHPRSLVLSLLGSQCDLCPVFILAAHL